MNFQEIYEKNKELDNHFLKQYSKDKQLFKKNCIEFLVEVGEFVNETRCFKYWSTKEPDKNKVLEEYADCITMILFFFNYLDLELDDIPDHYPDTDILDIINKIYEAGTELMEYCDSFVVKEIYSNLLYVGELLGFHENEIIDAIVKKQKIVLDRLNSDY